MVAQKADVNHKVGDGIMKERVYRRDPKSMGILEAILRILDDDGPRPMRNLRPVEKQRTGAEQFQIDHHGQYDARVRKSRDKIDRVHAHNKAYPALYDELERKRSIANPTAFSLNQKPLTINTEELYRCHNFSTIKRNIKCEPKKTNSRTIKTKSAISKYRIRSFIPSKRYFKITEAFDKGCQCAFHQLSVEKVCVSTSNDREYDKNDKISGNNCDAKCESEILIPICNTQAEEQHSNSSIDKNAKTDIDSQNPETVASLSSYSSYFSMDHEPMVQE